MREDLSGSGIRRAAAATSAFVASAWVAVAAAITAVAAVVAMTSVAALLSVTVLHAAPPQGTTTSQADSGKSAFVPRPCTEINFARPGAAVRRVAYKSPESADELRTNISCLLAGSVRSGHWGVVAVSLTRRDTLFTLNASEPLLPASTMKLFTSALALDQLGPAFQFRTLVLSNGVVDSVGMLHGDLILQGGGDPAFSNRFLEGDASAPVSQLANLVSNAGIRGITGDLVADPFAFESRLVPDGWLSRYLSASYAARVSALSLNGNIASVVVAPGDSEDSAEATLDPPAASIAVQNSVRTIPNSRSSRIVVRKVNDTTYSATGWIGERSTPQRFDMVIEDPVQFTAGAFRTALDNTGVQVKGETVIAATPPDASVVATLLSPPLYRLVTAMNRESINHYAELIFRNAGRGTDGLVAGSAASAGGMLSDFMTTKVGADAGAVFAVDGSGLSVLNRVSARSLVQLLSYAHSAPWSSAFHASLPVAGISATLRDRMRGSPAQGNLHAKTGTTSAVISLGGYVTSESGELLAFACIYNGTDRDRARVTIDEIGISLANFARTRPPSGAANVRSFP